MTTKRCTKCCEEKPLDQFSIRKASEDGLRHICRNCHSTQQKEYYSRTRPLRVAQSKRYVEANRENISAYQKNWRSANREYAKEYHQEWRKSNPGRWNSITAKRRAAKLQATPPWLTKDDFAEIRKFYTLSNELTELNGRIHHVDHITPLINDIVCGLHVPWNMQVLTGPENLSKSNKLILPPEMAW